MRRFSKYSFGLAAVAALMSATCFAQPARQDTPHVRAAPVHVEGFVNQYKLESIAEDGKRLVFISEAIENIPAGWRAKGSYEVLGPDQIRETFELAGPDGPFEVYTRSSSIEIRETRLECCMAGCRAGRQPNPCSAVVPMTYLLIRL